MAKRGKLRLCERAVVVCGVAAACGLVPAAASAGLGASAAAKAATGHRAAPASAPPGAVSPLAATGTPELYPAQTAVRGQVQQVRQIVQCGGTMYAVGKFTQLSQNGTVYTRTGVFSFSATAPYTITGWDPAVNGTVESIAFNGGNCANAYIGGKFSMVNGTPVSNIAEISTSTGDVVTSFAHSASGQISTLLAAHGHLLVGGYFSTINGSSADHYYASLNPSTGKDDGYLRLAVSGSYQYPGAIANTTNVYNQQLNHAGTAVLVEGDFTSVGGQHRQQIFMLGLGSSSARVTNWTSDEFNNYCAGSHPFYIKAASWSPDDSTVYVATTGYHALNWNWSFPLTGLCDALAAFPATQTAVSHDWVTYTGCDSYFATAADSSGVYVGGHERWADNQDGCDQAGPGAVPAPGMALFTSSGSLVLNSAATAGLYNRTRGWGADDMLLTSAGLWVASDNFNSQRCDGALNHSGLCFLPYR